jgi:hypothetical protein
MIELFKKLGVWVENENCTPNPGDIIFYDWQDNGKGDNKGNPEHVGIVEKVTNGKIIVIEGNYDGTDTDRVDGVERREISVNGRYVRGYGVPKYDKAVSSPWYAEAQKWVVEKGISDGTRPTETATRAEVWAMLQRLKG